MKYLCSNGYFTWVWLRRSGVQSPSAGKHLKTFQNNLNKSLEYMGGECNIGHFAYKHFRYATLDSHRSHERKALFPFKIKRTLIFFNSFQNSIIILCFSISFISLLRVYMTNERLWSRRRVARCRKVVLWNILLFWPTFQSDVFGYPNAFYLRQNGT